MLAISSCDFSVDVESSSSYVGCLRTGFTVGPLLARKDIVHAVVNVCKLEAAAPNSIHSSYSLFENKTATR